MHFQSKSPSRERDHRISLMPMAHGTNAQGGSFLREISALAENRREAGSLPLWLGVLLLASTLGGIIAAVLLVQAVVSVSQRPPAASPDVPTSASSGTPPSHASSVPAHGQQGSN